MKQNKTDKGQDDYPGSLMAKYNPAFTHSLLVVLHIPFS